MYKNQIKYLPIKDIVPYINNPRNNEAAINAVAGSIAEFGFQSPIIVDEKNIVIAGHTRLSAAQKLGLKEVPVVVAKGLTPAQVKAYRIADNKVAEFSSWDDKTLRLELEQLKDLDIDLALTGFEKWELDRYLEPLEENDLANFFETTESKDAKPKLATCPDCGKVFEL